MNISTGIMRAICMPALLALFAPAAGAKDYSTTLADNVDVVYAVNTSDLIARVKRVQNYNKSMVAKVEVPKTIKYKSGGKTYTLTVTKIGDGAFMDNENLFTVSLPASLQSIGQNCFTGCNSLERIECMAVTPPAMAMPCFSVDCRQHRRPSGNQMTEYPQ